MRIARLQTNDLGRAENFLGSLVTKDNLKELEKQSPGEPVKAPQVNGAVLPFRTDAKPRFSDPPAPPPQQPLPEKPDVARPHTFEPSSPSLKRSNTERPRSVPNASPVRQESPSQILTLVEALASAKKEIDSQSARLQDLEEMLQKERQAREVAEDLVKQLEVKSAVTPEDKVDEGLVIEEAFEPPIENTETTEDNHETGAPNGKIVDPNAISQSTILLEKRLEGMLGDMQDLKNQMESFKQRAESAESERDASRTTLAKMIEDIRAKEAGRLSSSTERAPSPTASDDSSDHILNGKPDETRGQQGSLLQKDALANGNIAQSMEKTEPGGSTVSTLSRRPTDRDPLLYHATPYASMLGVVMIGMGIMAYLNGWQPPKVDR